jgi:hypothetical protein
VLLDEFFVIFTIDECVFERGLERGWPDLVGRRCLKKCSGRYALRNRMRTLK